MKSTDASTDTNVPEVTRDKEVQTEAYIDLKEKSNGETQERMEEVDSTAMRKDKEINSSNGEQLVPSENIKSIENSTASIQNNALMELEIIEQDFRRNQI